MGKLFVDEKGPQENFKISAPFNMEEKLAYGTDIMHGYVANAWYIDDKLDKFTEEFVELEKSYLKTLQNPNIELKGNIILKKRFKKGVASLRSKDVEFYTALFELLIKYESMNLLFSINKMSIIFDSRLLEWLYILQERRIIKNAYLTKYTLTKYLDTEASEEVIKSILDLNTNSKEILNEIQKDMKKIVNSNKKNKRMKHQIEDYKEIIAIIRTSKHFTVDTPEKIAFDWSKVTFAMDLWITENKVSGNMDPHSTDIYLDNGINKLHFEKFEFKSICENVDSRDNAGIRVTDFLVAIAGNYIKSLHQSLKYDRNEPEKIKLLSEDFFDLTKEQFDLLKLMNYFFFSSGQYSIVTDTFFDDEVVFEAFLNYFDKFDKFEKYKMIRNKVHVEDQFKLTTHYFKDRWTKSLEQDILVKKIFTSTKNAVESGLLRPL